MSSLRSFLILVVSMVFLINIFVGCSGKGGVFNSEISEVKGFILNKNGVEVAEVGEYGLLWGDVEIETNQGDIFEVEFLDEGGSRIDLNSDNYSLSWDNGNSNYAEIEQHASLSKFEFHIHGIQEGQSSFEIHLLDEITKTEEYKSSPIPLKINNK
jgi:hypothetical protein